MNLLRFVANALSIATTLSSMVGGAHAIPISQETRGNILYVKEGGTGDCSSWENACDLQDALSDAEIGDEIWVAEGSYYPTESTDRTISFNLENGVAVYGGFVGTETESDQRDWVDNTTILSGDIGIQGDMNYNDNSYHVVYGTGLDATTILDGFIITAGNANGTITASYGGGMFNNNSSPTLTNVTFSGNSAEHGGGMWNDNSNPVLTNVIFSANSAVNGGGMDNDSSSPVLTNITFSGNLAEFDGGGMRNIGGSPMLTNATFSGNSATVYGGGMSNAESSPTLANVTFFANSANYGGGMYNTYYSSPALTNVTFTANSADHSGGGMFNVLGSTPTLTNAIMWGNPPGEIVFNPDSIPVISYSDIPGDYPGEGNISRDPFLGPLADNGGFTQTQALLPGSPAIDAGSPSVCPATDQRGAARPIDGNVDGISICDMGAYEYVPYYSYLPLIVK